MSTTLNIGIVGTSVISSAFIKAAQESKAFNVKALFSRDQDKGSEFCETHHIESLYTAYEDLLNDESIQVIYLASPNELHYPQAKMALLAGKDVISEKPMVSSLKEALDLKQTAEQANRFIVEAITSRALPNLKVIKDNLPKIGELHLIQVDMAQYSSRYGQLKQGLLTNVFDPAHSGGALYDIGIYTVSVVLSLFGKPEKTTYTANLFSNGVDTSGILTLEYPNFKAVCSFGKDSYGLNQIILSGDLGYIQVVGAPSALPQVFLAKDKLMTNLSLPQHSNPLFQETIVFSELFESRDMAHYDALWEHSLWLAEIMERSRKQAGIVFKADQR